MITRAVSRLESRISQGQAYVVPFNAHYEARTDLREALHRAVNLLKDRPVDWEKPRGIVKS